jgi:hypothetical protein
VGCGDVITDPDAIAAALASLGSDGGEFGKAVKHKFELENSR